MDEERQGKISFCLTVGADTFLSKSSGNERRGLYGLNSVVFLDGTLFEQLALGFYEQSRYSFTSASLTHSVVCVQMWSESVHHREEYLVT